MAQRFNKQFGFSSYAKIGSIAFLALMLLSLSAAVAPRVSADSQILTISFGGATLQGSSSSNAFLTVYVTVTNNVPGAVPPGMLFQLTAAYNGVVYTTQTVSLAGHPENSWNYSFDMPFEGSGDYVWTGYVFNANGNQIFAFSVIDPLIEPEW
jgi:ABC-type amino acid transport system permease subunit